MALTEERFLALMEIMNEKQSKDIESRFSGKLAEMKEDLSGTIQKVSERQDKLESDQIKVNEHQAIMKDQLDSLTKNVEEVKKIASASQETSKLSNITEANNLNITPTLLAESEEKDEARAKFSDLLDKSKRTISLHPFTQNDIESELKRGAKDEDEAKVWAVQAFLRYEMNMKHQVISTLNLENIFPPPDQSNWENIFVTFSTLTMANTVWS